MINKISALLLIVLLFSCIKDEDHPIDYEKCNINMVNYDFTSGIDYNNPEKYLIPGEQSEMDEKWRLEVTSQIGEVPGTILGVQKVWNWINQNFVKFNGSDIGGNTLNQLYEGRTIYDSHSAALIISGTLRKLGFPTVIIEAASIEWAYNFRNGDKSNFEVHAMTEVFVNEKWILLDDNGTFVMDYDPENPFISPFNPNLYPDGLFVYEKGVDTWDYGVKSENDAEQKIKWFSSNIICFEEYFDTTDYDWKF
jgi:hypothetical protein